MALAITFLKVTMESLALEGRKICGDFLPGNWSKTDSILVKPLSGGFMNVLLLCELPESLRDDQSKPDQVIARQITGNNPFCSIGEAGEALFFKALGEANLGPKLYGISPGWRLEEYIPSRCLDFLDIRNEETLKLVAASLARIHSLDVELPKNPMVFKRTLFELVEKTEKLKQSIKYEDLSQLVQEKLRFLTTIDSKAEMEFVFDAIEKIPHRVVCSHNDFHANNVLVRIKSGDMNDKESQELTSNDILAIDVEMATYFYRGNDISLLLNHAAYDFRDSSNFKFVGPLDESLERTFIRTYLEVWKHLNPAKFNDAIDSEENIMKEQKLLSLLRMAYTPIWFIPNVLNGTWEEHLYQLLLERRNFDLQTKESFLKL